MRVLLDTDAFCKLAAAGIIEDAVHLLGVGLDECGRLPAVPHMLRRGRLRELFGHEVCDVLMPIAEAMPTIAEPSEEWLDRLTPIDAIDPGEALIFASAAQHGTLVMSGDKRALRALKDLVEFRQALGGRIVVLEAILLALCEELGTDEIQRRVQPFVTLDQTIKICFSNPTSTNPVHCLRSFLEHLTKELAPLLLWNQFGGTT